MEIDHGVFGTGLDDEVSAAALGVELFCCHGRNAVTQSNGKFIAKTKAISPFIVDEERFSYTESDGQTCGAKPHRLTGIGRRLRQRSCVVLDEFAMSHAFSGQGPVLEKLNERITVRGRQIESGSVHLLLSGSNDSLLVVTAELVGLLHDIGIDAITRVATEGKSAATAQPKGKCTEAG